MIKIIRGNCVYLLGQDKNKQMTDSNAIKLHYEGMEHSIDANTLLNSLIHLTNVVEIINDNYGGGAKKVKIMVDVPEPGSFLIGVRVIEWAKGLFGSKQISYASDLINILKAIIQVFRERKGKPLDSQNKSQVINNFGPQYTSHITKIYNLQPTREAISKTFETLNNDENVDGFEIIGKDIKIQIPSEEFSDLVYTDFDSEIAAPEEIVSEDDIILVIKSLNFEKGKQWTFLYKGENFKLNVKDDALMEKISEGMQFGKGDAIRVRLKTIRKYSPEYGVHIVTSRNIIKFYELIKYQYTRQGTIDR